MRSRPRGTRRRVHPIQEDVANIGDEISSLGEKLGQHASEETKEAIRSIHKALDRLGDDASDLTRAGVGELRETIQENPFTGVVVGIGIGFMLALMLRR